MNEQAEREIRPKTPEQKPTHEAIGVRMLGEIDPRILSREAFQVCPDALFHGSGKPFNYSQKYDYSSDEFFTDGDGSQTLGQGFYTTNDRGTAENYSRVRQYKNGEPVVLTLLPYQARVLDLRAKTDPSFNASVPKEVFEKWYEFYKDYYSNNEKRQNVPWYVQTIEDDYWEFLNRAKKLDKPLDVRVMLCTSPDKDLQSHGNPHPPYVKLFSNFMKQAGYDGLVSNEGGEGSDGKDHASYIFYNLEKIGTYESWHQNQK